MNVLSKSNLLFGGNTQLCFGRSLYGDSFQGAKWNFFYSTLWKDLRAIAGPTHNIHNLKDSVKDRRVDNLSFTLFIDKYMFRVIHSN